MERKTLLWALAGLLLLAGLAVLGWNRSHASRADAGGTQAEVIAALERIDANQAKLAERMDRLEMANGRMPGATMPPPFGSALGNRGAAANAGDQNGAKFSPAQMEQQAAQQLHAMDERLISDPLSPQWASSNEKTIGDFLAPGNLKQEQLPVPKNSQATCRSHLCRISMTFPDESVASQTQERLLMAIARTLPNAQTFLRPRDDGTVEMVIFASDPSGVH